jgi:glycosyltransferase involved in cell wall biosynthesis
VPGNGGVDRTVFHPGDSDLRSSLGLDANTRIVVNPRGVREYVEWKAFLHAARAVSATRPDVHFVCAGMAEHAQVSRYVRRLGIGDRVTLLPSVGHEEMADVFRAADVSVSPATHDGTPNTLLEAMACGAVPVVGAVSSVLEWIEDGRNGVVCDPTDPSAMTAAINRALDDTELRARAIEFNLDVVAERADLVRCRELIDRFYQRVLDRAVSGTARGGR